jgi:hypothetical protein
VKPSSSYAYGIDLCLDRPLEGLSVSIIMGLAKEALGEEPVNLELLSFAKSEFRERGENVEAISELLRTENVKSIPWLKGLKYRVRHLVETFDWEPGPGRNTKVYFILLCPDGINGASHPWGLYVGQTYRKIEVRLSQHLDKGHRLRSRKVTRRGWGLLYSACELAPTMKQKNALQFEKLVLSSLRGEGEGGPLRSLPPSRVIGG